MHVEHTRRIALLGVLAALSTVLTVLGTVISVNTVFFTAAAAFLTGIVVVRYGMAYGTVFFAVCAVLDGIFNPDKLHVFLYLGFAGYLLFSEGTYRLLSGKKEKVQENPNRFGEKTGREWLHRLIRFLFFELIYYLLLVFVPRLFVPDSLLQLRWFYPVMLGIGIVAWLVYDLAYAAFKNIFFQRFGKLI